MENLNKSIWNNVVDELIKRKMTIATMESCTGGGIANEITNISGASAVISESYVTYSNEAKIKFGVSEKIINEYGVYSTETAIEMARTVKKLANSDFSIGITGQLGRIDPNNPMDKVNCVWYAIINQNGECFTDEIHVDSDERYKQKRIIIDIIGNTILKYLHNL